MNPRETCASTRFPGVRLKPLGHLSQIKNNKIFCILLFYSINFYIRYILIFVLTQYLNIVFLHYKKIYYKINPMCKLCTTLKITFIFLFLTSCLLHKVEGDYESYLTIDDNFSIINKKNNDNNKKYWYESFGDNELNVLVKKATISNLTIKEAWSRLLQSRISAKIAGSKLYPEVNASIDIEGQDADINSNNGSFSSGWNDSKSGSLNLKWEVDLWGKIRANQKAQYANFKAAYSDFHYTSLLISSLIARSYFDLKEQKALLKLVEKQIEKDKQFYELIQLRKSTGRITILDVQRQKQQLLSSKYKIPQIKLNIEKIEHNLAVLSGLSSASYEYFTKENLPDLPKMPYIGTPQDLIKNNHQIIKAYQKLKSSDYTIAVELAKFLPSISFNTFYKIGSPISGGSESTIYSIVTSIIQNIFDAGRIRNQYKYSKEVFNEKLYSFENIYLEVIKSIEDAISKESYIKKRFKILKEQVDLGKSNLKESIYQYRYGLIEYINVLESFVRLYDLEEKFITIKRDMIDARVDLHLALGGIVIDNETIDNNLKEKDKDPSND